jgi:hypothetical protein
MTKRVPLTPQSRVIASPQQVSCDVASETVILSLESGEYFGLNEVGATIWRLIQEPHTVEQLRDALLEEYEGVDESECLDEVLRLLEELWALQLVQAA